MKKFLFGSFIFWGSFIIFSFCFIYSIMNPGIFNNISGLRGSLLCNNSMEAFIISLIISIIGLVVCGYEAYHKEKR